MPPVLTALPSPPQAEWYLGPLPIRAYAIAILVGILLAWWVLDRRYTAKGGPPDTATDVAVFWMVPFGIVGARIYHVLTSPDAYFGPDGDPVRILYVWHGGLGIWGAVAAGALGAWLGLRRRGLRLAPFADALAPGLLVAQAAGRLGNYFNQELYGAPTTLPWGLQVDDAHRVAGYPAGTLFHPTFLYEMLWNLAAVGVLVWAERRFRLGHGRVFWLYVMLYTAGRVWIEALRIDDAERVLGVRLNVWTSILVFLLALVAFLLSRRSRGRPDPLWLPGRGPAARDTPGGADDGGSVADDGGADDGGADDGGADDPARAVADGPAPAVPRRSRRATQRPDR
ncbi:prolipoprotein diacylglyceryl transferase [Georgenia sp. TF02-10]|uniref:prolipoprotein diacylglyceryl transferase n=1 Tax=Georgenia sp. TF02-10 TaxID=2917725 RepID=UPI001FA805A3|nr:prolipoprotein diacylglyceryl transferase [Georgenia sp. TF02-10]UNX56158.1 prolipoprotein diacylglyceryl transferase [Georgenia sp. TF02-10]